MDLLGAFGLLTLIPVPRRAREVPLGATLPWFPLVGLAFGLVWAVVPLKLVALLGAGTRRVVLDPAADLSMSLLLAALVVVVSAAGSRFMHLDGLADTFDALWGSRDRERRLEIMADSSIGAFGTAAVSLDLIIKVAALASACASVLGLAIFVGTPTRRLVAGYALLAAPPVYGRAAAVVMALRHSPAKADGLGATVLAGASRPALVVSLAVVVLLPFIFLPWWAALLGGVGFLAWTLTLAWGLSRMVGGVTGDLFGATIELTETAAAVMVAVALLVTVLGHAAV